MGVPAHDERDQEFAELHNLEIIEVLSPQSFFSFQLFI